MANILVVVHTDDYRTGSQEEQGLEKGMRHQMENGHGICRSAQRHRHVPELAKRGIGHHAFDVVLNDSQKPHEEGSDGTNRQNEIERRVRQLKKWRHPRHHENARGHHGGGVNQCRYRRRALHRVRQPGVQRKLCTLAHCANEEADAGNGDHQPGRARKYRFRNLRCLSKNFGVIQAAGIGQYESDSQDETKVTHSIDEEGLHIGKHCARLFEPKADQKVAD